ncbi:hypothetical protein, partial [Salmonella sp. SAL4443]|uniref:hypothetical protein n=1 Tax=Salmonella sp. SAL4443 TaxID=3159898 RepID=UPI003978177B
DLSPILDRLWLRGPYLTLGVWFAALGLGAYLVETAFIGMDGVSEACLFTFMWAVVGFVLMLVGLPKHQIARFKTKTGIAALDVFESGPTK